MTVVDQLGEQFKIAKPLKRVISIVPSQTEFLLAIGLKDLIVGRTRFCIHPHDVTGIEMVGGTKQLNVEAIAALRPHLIIGNKEENDKGQIEWLKQRFPVWMSDIKTIDDSLDMMSLLGDLFGKREQAGAIIQRIQFELKEIPQYPVSTAYFIWRNPYMVAANNTFIHSMMKQFGFSNVFSDHTRYPVVTLEALAERHPELIMLSSEPYHFTEKHFEEFQCRMPDARIIIVDGELFSWYGSRMLPAADYLKRLYEITSGNRFRKD